MKKNFIVACATLLFATGATCFANGSSNGIDSSAHQSAKSKSNSPKTHQLISPKSGGGNTWISEDHSGKMTVTMNGSDTMEIITPKGLTLWYDQKITGNYEITYRVQVVMEGGEFDRLSDLNCFWAANDPKYPDNLYERAAWRNGSFEHYNTLDLFYVGYGGNHNSTTRFRQYDGKLYGASRDEIKPVIKEYTGGNNLLKPNQWITIKITVKKNKTTYSVDGKTLFSHPITEELRDGYFGLRLLTNHTRITGFDIKQK